jgi:hypothetical protein
VIASNRFHRSAQPQSDTLGAHDDTVSHGAHDDTVIDGYAAQLTVAQFRDEYDAVLEAMLEHDHADDPEGTTSLPEMSNVQLSTNSNFLRGTGCV